MENDGDILCTAKWLNDNLSDVTVLDVHWQWDGSEFAKSRIPTAKFFDLTETKDQASPYSYMLPSAEYFADKVGNMGITATDHIVVYDSGILYAACRVYWMFKAFGHKGKVTLLNGGYNAWKAASYSISEDPLNSPPSYDACQYEGARLQPELVKSFDDIVENIKAFDSGGNGICMLDARLKGNYDKGHIPHALSATWSTFTSEYTIGDTTFKGFAPVDELELRLQSLAVPLSKDTPIITSCQSGISGLFLYVVLDLVKAKRNGNVGQIALYDGSFGEYSKRSTNIARSMMSHGQ